MQITVSSYSKRGLPPEGGRLRCAIVTPVGPGHELLAEDSAESVAAAYERNAGPFSDIDIIRVDDTQGLLGRSEARNRGVREAQRRQAQWVFFLDADDLMHPDAFGAMRAYHRDHDAVWGLICELAPDEEGYVERQGQVREIERPEAILLNDPTLTLQMGHFVRTAAAMANPFDTALDCGEDFDYYLRLWERFRCRKAPVPLFLNRRGMHATGARSATGRQWRASVERIIAARCASADLACEFVHDGQRFRFRVSDPFDVVQRHHLKGTFFELEELRFLRERVPRGATIVDVGANGGNHAVYFSRFLEPRRLVLFEPDPRWLPVLRANLESNRVNGADIRLPGLTSATGGTPRLDAAVPAPVDLIRISMPGKELEVLAGAAELIRRQRPRLMVKVGADGRGEFESWRKSVHYETTSVFAHSRASNFLLEPT
jgi:glycosyltransferase involved in cell wall biosynthesis